MAEFMSDEDLEALKADADAEVPGSNQSTHGQVAPPVCIPSEVVQQVVQ